MLLNTNGLYQRRLTGANALRLMRLYCGHRPQNESKSTQSTTMNSYIMKHYLTSRRDQSRQGCLIFSQ